MLFTLTGCGSKTVTTTASFKSTMEGKGFTTMSGKDQFPGYEYLNDITVALKENSYQIEFFDFTDVDHAVSSYDTNKAKFKKEVEDSSSSSYVETNIGNYSVYTTTVNGKYKYICRVDNTLLYIDVDEKYKDEVKDIVKELGY
jgi:hypothetical protein